MAEPELLSGVFEPALSLLAEELAAWRLAKRAGLGMTKRCPILRRRGFTFPFADRRATTVTPYRRPISPSVWPRVTTWYVHVTRSS